MKLRFLLWVIAGFAGLVLYTAGCEAESAGDEKNVLGSFGGSNPADGTSGGAENAGNTEYGTSGGGMTGAGCPAANATQYCTCDKNGEAVPGRQGCSAVSGWRDCECYQKPGSVFADADLSRGVSATDPAANRRSDVFFNWWRSMPTFGTCEGGRYEGGFDGVYNPTIIMGYEGGIPVAGNVGFDMAESSTGEYYEVSGGYMRGLALFQYPFEGEMHGRLNCESLYFDGSLQNCFYIVYGAPYAFKGIARAIYDPINHAFVGGVWSVTDADYNGVFPPPIDAQPGAPPPVMPWGVKGGSGNWSMTLMP